MIDRKFGETSTALRQAQEFRLATQPISLDERRATLVAVVDRIPRTSREDTKGVSEIKSDIKRLLATDPLTDQQAGILSRWRRYFNPFAPHEEREKLSWGESVEMQVGDWHTIQEICMSTPDREEAWQKASDEAFSDDRVTTVYRGMKIDQEDVQRIYEDGIIPPGLWRFDNFDNIAWRKIEYKLDSGEWLRDRSGKEYLLNTELPISKRNVLTNHWYVASDAWTVDTPDSLGISTTPPETMGIAGMRGNHIIEMELPSTRLIQRWEEQGMVDYTALYYIEPSAIRGIYDTGGYRRHMDGPLVQNLGEPVEKKK